MSITGQETNKADLVARARAAYEVVAVYPDQRGDLGWSELLELRNFIPSLCDEIERLSGGAKMFAGMAGRNLSRAFDMEQLLREALTVCSDGNAADLARRIEEALARADEP